MVLMLLQVLLGACAQLQVLLQTGRAEPLLLLLVVVVAACSRLEALAVSSVWRVRWLEQAREHKRALLLLLLLVMLVQAALPIMLLLLRCSSAAQQLVSLETYFCISPMLDHWMLLLCCC